MMTDKSPLESSPLAADRIAQVERDLRFLAEKPIDISFDPKGTPLFSMMELARSYPRRCVDLGDAIRSLIATNRIIPATIVGRALIETIAMGCLYSHDMEQKIATKDPDRLELRLQRFYMGIKGEKVKPVHVMDALRHLDKLDAAYLKFLDGKYGMFTRFIENLKASGDHVGGESFDEAVSVMKNYDFLSEVCHPNGIGTQFLYPDASNETEEVTKLRARLRFASLLAIWHGHYLVAALDKISDLPERYWRAFKAGS